MSELYHADGIVDNYTFVLSTADHRHLGQLINIDDTSVTVKVNLNSADEISFDIYETVENNGETITVPNWEDITSLKYVYCVELNEYFVCDVQVNDSKDVVSKTITGTGASEVELSNINIYGTEINTDEDIDRDDYMITYFYNETAEASLLNRILDRAPQWSIGHIDTSLKNIQRTFSIDGTSIYDFLTGDCASEFNCLFVFDSVDRVINAYDLYTVCNECGYRGDYDSECPECGSTDLEYYGEDTTIYVDSTNLTDNIQFTTDTESIKNCFHLVAGDDDMDAAIRMVNPNGSNYITYFTEETLADMPDELVEKITSYDEIYDYYSNEYSMSFDSTAVSNYNTVKDKYVDDYYDYTYNTVTETGTTLTTMVNPVVGYDLLSEYYYETVDLYYYLKSGRMPNVSTSGSTNATTEATALNEAYTEGNFKTIGLKTYSSSTTQALAESTIKTYAKAFVKTGYVTVDVEKDSTGTTSLGTWTAGSSYGTWTGRLCITNASDSEDIVYTNTFTITISADEDCYTAQYIVKKLMANQSTEDGSLFDPLGYASLYYNTTASTTATWVDNTDAYTSAINEYSYSRLESFRDALEAAIVVYDEMNSSSLSSEIRTHYANLVTITEAEMEERSTEMNYVIIMQDLISEMRSIIRTLLNMEYYLNGSYYDDVSPYDGYDFEESDLWQNTASGTYFEYISGAWTSITLSEYTTLNDARTLFKTFCIYRRDDEYSNSNYISDGLTNAELFDNAREFLDKANKELQTAATPQHSISASLYNLFLMDAFEPLKDKFELGNWIRVKSDDTVYRLRLTSYTFSWGGIENISTEFSDVTIAPGVCNDINSILSQASSIAGSYSYTATQASKGDKANSTIEDWVESGLNSALVNINNNTDEEIKVDSNGIWARRYDDITELYEDEQLRITHNVLAFTDDNWSTVKCALGKQEYESYIDGTLTTLTGYGLNADFMQGGQINGSQIISGDIYSDNYSSTNGTHLNLTDGTFVLGGDNGLVYDGDTLTLGSGISLDSSTGNVTISNGTLSANTISGGSITIGSNFSVDSSGNLTCSNASFSGSITSASISSSSININNNFIVTSSGVMTATSGTFSGSITGSSITTSSFKSQSGNNYVQLSGATITIGGSDTWDNYSSMTIKPYYIRNDYGYAEGVYADIFIASTMACEDLTANTINGDTPITTDNISSYIPDVPTTSEIRDMVILQSTPTSSSTNTTHAPSYAACAEMIQNIKDWAESQFGS